MPRRLGYTSLSQLAPEPSAVGYHSIHIDIFAWTSKAVDLNELQFHAGFSTWGCVEFSTSRIMKNSLPGSPCTTIFCPSSNCTVSKASAMVRRSHFSKDSVERRINTHVTWHGKIYALKMRRGIRRTLFRPHWGNVHGLQ